MFCSKVIVISSYPTFYQFTGDAKQCNDVTEELMTSSQKFLREIVDLVEDYNCAKFQDSSFCS